MKLRIPEHLKENLKEKNNPEYRAAKKRKEENLKKRVEDRLNREGEMANLFKDYDKIYGKRRYMPQVPELLNFLKSKKNAVTFWKNPHVKMIYNVSDHHNFLLSIYAEETDNRKYEEWLRKYFSNPFVNHLAVNYETVVKKYLQYNGRYELEKELLSTCRTVNNLNSDNRNGYDDLCLFNRCMYTGAAYSGAVDLRTYHKLSKPIADEDLLDSAAYEHLSSIRTSDELIQIINPLVATDNNFIRLDVYNTWRTNCKNEWNEVKAKDPDMFAILDALVKSRKIYLKEINK